LSVDVQTTRNTCLLPKNEMLRPTDPGTV